MQFDRIFSIEFQSVEPLLFFAQVYERALQFHGQVHSLNRKELEFKVLEKTNKIFRD